MVWGVSHTNRHTRSLAPIAWRLRTTGVALLLAALLAPLSARATDDDPMVLADRDGLVVRAHFQAGINAVAEENLFWNFAESFAPQYKFNPDSLWLEAYVKPGISITAGEGEGLTVYGKVSAVASGTLGTDAFAAGDTARISLEEGYAGLRGGGETGFDISVGPREYKAGTGMLLANGGSSGFKRGALKLGPHKAWEMAVLGTVRHRGFAATGFFLDANESPGSDSGTTILGADLRYDGAPGRFVGGTIGKVLTSTAPYPQAAPGGIGVPAILPGARDGLSFMTLYGRGNPFGGVLAPFFLAGDFAYERNRRIDMEAWAARVQVGYEFERLPWSPTLSYTYQTFSGDDPATTRLERFDPLYYEGSPSSWSTGSKSSMVFINSNINAHQVAVQVQPSQQDSVTLRVARISANELLSPIQFGQATRVEIVDGVVNPIAGVLKHHLSDDIFVEYSRIVTPNVYLTAGISFSFPGAGINSIVPVDAPLWSGAFANVVVNF